MISRSPRLAALCLVVSALVAQAAPNQLSEVSVTVEEDAQPLVDVLRRLESAHGLNYVVAEDVLRQAGTVTVHLKQVPLDVALEAICSACGLQLEIRGPVLVIVPKAGVTPVVPRVETGTPTPALVEQARQRATPPPPAPPAAPARPAPTPAPAEPDLAQTVGTLLGVDQTERRLVLRVDGIKREFYLPDRDDPGLPGLQVSRLEQSLETLKPGTRIAILYRRDAIRPVLTDLVGGAFSGTVEARLQEQARLRRAREKRQAAGAAGTAPVGTPDSGAAPVLDPEPAEESAGAPGGSMKVIPAGPAASDKAAPEGPGTESGGEEGILAGKFLGLEGDEVKVQRAGDGQVVSCWLPPAEDAARRTRVQTTLAAVEEGTKIYLTFELREGKRFVTNTITEAR